MRQLIVLCSLSLLLTTSVLHAQVLYGTLTGNVTDSSNAAVPNAKVEALNNNTGIARETVTDERGVYVFRDLQSGSYTVTIVAAAFSKAKFERVDISANTVRRGDVKLQLAQVAESVTVSATGLALQTDRADVNVQLQKSLKIGRAHV